MDFILNRNKKTTEIDFKKTIETLDDLIEKNINIDFIMKISYEIPLKYQNPSFAKRLIENYLAPAKGYEVKGYLCEIKQKTKTNYELELCKKQLAKKEDNTKTYNPIRPLSENKIEIKYSIKKTK